MFAWQSLQERQWHSDLVVCVCAPNSGGGVNSWLCHTGSWNPFPCVVQWLWVCLVWALFLVLGYLQILPHSNLNSFFSSPVFLFLSIIIFVFWLLTISFLYFRKCLLVSVKAFDTDFAKIKSHGSYWFSPLGCSWMSFHFNSQPDGCALKAVCVEALMVFDY